MSNDLVSIIIVNFNGKDFLEKCLDSLFKINYSNFEVIIADNYSIDGSTEFVKSEYPKIKLVELDENYGYAEANNIAAKIAKGDYMIFLNNDTIVTPDFVDELIKIMKNDSMIAISQSLLLKLNGDIDSSGDYVDTFGRAYSAKTKPSQIQNILSARGAAMIVRKNIFWDLGGFDKEFFATFEDVDIGWRAWLLGYKVVLVPNSIVYHIGGQTIKTLNPLIQFHGVKNTLILRLTNFELSFAFKSIVSLFFVSSKVLKIVLFKLYSAFSDINLSI